MMILGIVLAFVGWGYARHANRGWHVAVGIALLILSFAACAQGASHS